ncbi:MAG: maleylacetoacetate isomerase [Bdellovibrio sp.]|nr:MAG: maleylacetoacetate isomerase [Bdellovibrio sp.]
MFSLYSYFRSSSSYRVRIALHYKKIPFEYKPVHLLKEGGEQHLPSYKEINPAEEVPTLVTPDKKTLSQSMAIICYLEDIKPLPALFPKDPYLKALTLQICEMINSGIQPIQNLKVLQALGNQFHLDREGQLSWARQWITKGFLAIEKILKTHAKTFSLGDSLTAADLFLVPQIYNARRFQVDLSPFPTITQIEKNCLSLPAFQKAHPDNQPDTPKT